MDQKQKSVTVPVNIDFASDNKRKWYFDVYGVQGAQFHKVHVFVGSDKDENRFDDIGKVVSTSVSTVEGHPDIECINIGIRGNTEYQLLANSYVVEKMVKDKEETMF
ncbi:hypothetical protein GOP47_0021033 [Adiantum capillus-veneris]|uniref:Uncharacterized protein n=1 Tax=Adiantum capillus-veneris TaxID=13818 RepID=A0A9D4UAB8_ADICA|nr:hypothetical protein GOP47_0021033 [Adiantum capillus-veneris]